MITTHGQSLVEADPVRCRCEELSTTSHEHKANAHSILEAPGNCCCLNSSSYPWNSPSPILSSSCNGHQAFGHCPLDNSVYLSPPSTSLQPGRSVPLPNNYCKAPDSSAILQPLESRSYFGGILDSPPIEEHGASRFQGPLSPPPTLPTQTLSLPPTEYDQLQFKEMDAKGLFNNCQSHALIQQDDEARPRLLSPPLSPDWVTMEALNVPFPTSSQGNLFFPSIVQPAPLFLNSEDAYIGNLRPFDLNLYDLHDFSGTSSTQRQWQPANVVTDHRTLDVLSSRASHLGLLCSPEQEDLDMTSSGCLPVSPRMISFPPLSWKLDDLDSTLNSPLFSHPDSPPISPPASSDYEFDYRDYDDGTMLPLSPPSSPSLRLFSELPVLEGESDHHSHDEMFKSLAPLRDEYLCNPAPPNSSRFESCIENDTERVLSIRSFPGVETDDELIPVDLASRSSVPEHCIVIPSTPYITPSTLIPFPQSSSVDYWSVDSRSQQLGDAAMGSRGRSLLLYDEQSFISGSSRIGAELDQLDPVLVAGDAELKQLLDLRSRTLALERRARMVEAQYENIRNSCQPDGVGGSNRVDVRSEGGVEEGEREAQLHNQQEEARMQALLAAQAKQERKQEKERLREVSALVKIKLRERGVSFKRTPPSPTKYIKSEDMDVDGIFCTTDGFLQDGDAAVIYRADRCGPHMKSKRDAVTTMPQLVARMILRRREARLHPAARAHSIKSSTATNDTDLRGRKERLHRNSPLALSASTDNAVGHDEILMEQSDFPSHVKHHRPPHSPLQRHMDVDWHTRPDSINSSLDDLDVCSKFGLLSLSNT
ncbi:hypothetical protein AX15_000326 [Amanita polypyramis BW_CC]|nr:hypothetical protein AX15_000326 [Amanita polypyramis BW_CC]